MKLTILLFLTLFATGPMASAQTIRGVITAPDGGPVPLANVEVKNTQSGVAKTALASATGEYVFESLAPGTYDLSITSIRYLAPFAKKGLAVAKGETQKLDVKLNYTLMGGTPGEGHEPALSAIRRVAVKGPTPRMPDGKPDFSGVWSWPITADPGDPAFLPAGAPDGSLTPATYCLPHAVIWPNAWIKLVQTPKLLVVLYDDEDPAYRQIYLDGRPHPKNEDPTWYGHSVGHWEKDTLVIDRVGFNGKGWLDGAGHRFSEKLHIVDRYRRPDLGHLEVETTVEDPAVLKAPWTSKRYSILAPEEDVREYPCNENNVDPPHMKK